MEGKSLVTSKTAWAQIITMVLLIARAAGVNTDGFETDAIAQWLFDATTIAAAIYGLYGRVVANERITGIFRKKKEPDE